MLTKPAHGHACNGWPFDTLTPMKYGAILVDPPWRTELRSPAGYGKSPEAHYATMTLDELASLPVHELAGPGCYLFMWAVWPQLPQALWLMEQWGFRYVTGGDWVKRTANWKLGFGTGYVLRSSSEPFLIGRIGTLQTVSKSERNTIFAPELILDASEIPNLIEAAMREHSRKPDQMRQMIDRLLPRQYFCELFAREPWPGHDVWGNEPNRFAEAGS